ncbi:MAG: hypothetical protein HYU51_12330 [Candidatus Rokubacteria bacterium]|nr:hypothetical protein [Candidatus Rokubacteria bacterium]
MPIDDHDEWWNDIDEAILGCLAKHGTMSPGELARYVDVPESAVTSLLCLLASTGRVRICLVEHVQSGARNGWERVA